MTELSCIVKSLGRRAGTSWGSKGHERDTDGARLESTLVSASSSSFLASIVCLRHRDCAGRCFLMCLALHDWTGLDWTGLDWTGLGANGCEWLIANSWKPGGLAGWDWDWSSTLTEGPSKRQIVANSCKPVRDPGKADSRSVGQRKANAGRGGASEAREFREPLKQLWIAFCPPVPNPMFFRVRPGCSVDQLTSTILCELKSQKRTKNREAQTADSIPKRQSEWKGWKHWKLTTPKIQTNPKSATTAETVCQSGVTA